ncbi:MAG: AraC family transcriptional regulator [Treponema sp.]|nr:AraC family transcriptional regulator [Treponema sp.]
MNVQYNQYYSNVQDDGSEIVRYENESLPVKTSCSTWYSRPDCYVNHWHTDFEFIYCSKGHIYYSVNGEEIKINEGEMMFVNSCQMHYTFQKDTIDCETYLLVAHPGLYDWRIAEKYVKEVTASKVPPYIVMSIDNIREKQIIDCVVNIVRANTKDENGEKAFGHELEIKAQMYKLLINLALRVQNMENPLSSASKKKLETMRRMTGFVQKNYAEKITLDDIADAGIVCRSQACELFKRYMNKTPIEYLNDYRITKSTDLIAHTDMSITEISLACGFESSSYFTELFHRRMNMTPRDYRNMA